jgi:hypothetical protein
MFAGQVRAAHGWWKYKRAAPLTGREHTSAFAISHATPHNSRAPLQSPKLTICPARASSDTPVAIILRMKAT